MSKHRQPRRPKVPKQPTSHNRPRCLRPPTDARAHVTAMRELAALGWRLVEIVPDREPPVLWTVRARRHDGNVEIAVTDPDPDAAVEELLSFAACDEDEPSVELPPESALSPVSLRTRDELEAALNALDWTIVDGPTQTPHGWKDTMRRGHDERAHDQPEGAGPPRGDAPVRPAARRVEAMNQRCLDLAVMARGQLGWIGPDVHSLTTSELMKWMTVRIAVNNDARLREIAEDFDLRQASTERRGRAWFRQAMSRGAGLIVIAAGPHHEGPPPP